MELRRKKAKIMCLRDGRGKGLVGGGGERERETVTTSTGSFVLAGVSNLRSTGHIRSRMALNAAQYKIIKLLKTL